MAATGFRVIKPGLLTLMQDTGRYGYQHLGLSPGGPADEHAYLWAHRLLGDRPDAPALEITLGGLQLEAQVDTHLALTGADLQARLNDRPITPWCTYRIRAGDRLRFGYPRTGVRAYLAVAGGFRGEPVFGSVATVVRESLGGLDGRGRALGDGDWLPCEPAPPARERRVPARYIPDYDAPLTLRLMPGLQSRHFRETDRTRLFAERYTLSQRNDRMGARLEGPALQPAQTGIVSEPTVCGAVQVPPDGQPFVLLKDRQTIGGYPVVGVVHPPDLAHLAQRQAGAPVTFAPIAVEDSAANWQRKLGFLRGSGG